jgi:hypothetical protein
MSRIAAEIMIEADDGSNSTLHFAVLHVNRMLHDLKRRYYALWKGEERPAE